ncbi:MraY family glycosyltransferase [Thalassoroseus pseudoceratinae]|uniref:MraY family glycosyltransferase n=1 Tax=Thalassoroseus pseudoceratinae TaxID=2713176 RepID=UPI00142329B7|nr:MraY family glycosyltransferase [Thalassoroseus pseudoceratinae]
MLFFVIACLVPSCIISAITTAIVRRKSFAWGLVDQPNSRKVHESPTPLGGGIGIWLGVVGTIACAQLSAWFIHDRPELVAKLPEIIRPHLDGVLYRSGQLWAILACATVLAAMGLIDDRKNISWLPRLIIQILVVGILVFGVGVQSTVFVPLPLVSQLLTMLWMLVLINSFNFLDNMDGLSSGIALIAAILFATVMLMGERWLVGGALLVLAGSISGFLFFHNWPPARIFMGDCGSYFLGVMLSSMTVLGTYFDYGDQSSRHVILAPFCILAIPLYDFCSVMIIRILQRRSPFHPDKSHFSHRLTDLGLSRPKAVLTIHLATLTTGLGGLLLYYVSGWVGAALVCGLIACVLAIIAILETTALRTTAIRDSQS